MNDFLYCTSRLALVVIGFNVYWADSWVDGVLCAALALYSGYALWVEWQSGK